MAYKLEYQGGSGGQIWDDGFYTGVRTLYFTIYSDDIMFFQVDYDNNGKVVTREHGQRKGDQMEFALDFPDEYITSVEGSYDPVPGKDKINIVKSLVFKTSKGRTSPTFGRVFKDKFVLENFGLALVGFHGRAGVHIDALGAYFGSPTIEKLQAKGGDGGVLWDDGAYSGVRKLYFSIYSGDIMFFQVDYDNNGEVVTREHGQRKGDQKEFALDYPDEYITSVEGSYDPVPGQDKINIVKSMIFKTSKGRTSPTFGTVFNDKFVLECAGWALVGFHGRAGVHIDALGAYFRSPTIDKLQAKGGDGGVLWDDGAYTGVKKLYFSIYSGDIMFFQVDYDNNGEVVTREHGQRKGDQKEFALDYPNEYIISVEGSYDPVPGKDKINIVKSMIFKTSKGRNSPTFGTVFNDKFVLECAGRALVGFHGREGVHIDALGAYFGPPPRPLTE